MHLNDLDGLWWLDGDGSEVDLFEAGWDTDEDGLEDIFGDIVGAVGKVVSAPVDIVASVLPKPLKKPFKAVSTFASPTSMVLSAASGATRRRKPKRRKPKRRARPKTTSWGGIGRAAKAASSARSRAAKAIAARAGGGGSDQTKLMQTMVQMLGAKDLAKIAAASKPRLAARSSGSTAAGAQQGNELLVRMVAEAVNKKLGPDLSTINKRLKLAQNQRTATSEHININNKLAFRRKVLADLMRLSTCLPASHPTRQRIRKVGLMSGLL